MHVPKEKQHAKLVAAMLAALALVCSDASRAQTLPVVITSEYYPQPKVLVVHAFNGSGKDITGYNITGRHKNSDGTLDKDGGSERTVDRMSVLVAIQMAPDPTIAQRMRRDFEKTDNGIFEAGTTRDITLTGVNSSPELDFVADVIFYDDGTFDEHNEDVFKRMLASRQATLMQAKEGVEVMRNALADPTNDHPAAEALKELTRRRTVAMEGACKGFFFSTDLSNLRSMQQPQKGKTEREQLTQYVEREEKKVELMSPHCHLEIPSSLCGK